MARGKGRKPSTYDRTGKTKSKKGHIRKGLPTVPTMGKIPSTGQKGTSSSPGVTVTVKGTGGLTTGRRGPKKPGNLRPDDTVKVTTGRGRASKLGNMRFSMRSPRWNSSEAIDGDYPGGYSGGPAIIHTGSGGKKGKGKRIPGVVVYPGHGNPGGKKIAAVELVPVNSSSNANTPPNRNPQSEKAQYSFSAKDVNHLLNSSDEFIDIMASGNYVYVQKRIVLKHPACINFEPKSMSAILTDRAKSDQASYCLGIIKHKDGSIELSLPEKHKKFTRHGLGSTLWNSHFGDQMSRFLADNGSDLPPILPLGKR